MIIIGIAGNAYSGKSLLANHLVEYFKAWDYEVKRFSFAAPLKKILKGISGYLEFDDSYKNRTEEIEFVLYGDDSDQLMDGMYYILSCLTHKPEILSTKYFRGEAKKVYREVLQRVGTDIFRASLQSIWLFPMFISLCEFYNHYKQQMAIIDDVRFRNEANFVHSMGGCVIKIDTNRKDDYTDYEHTSEKIDVPYDILLNGDLAKNVFLADAVNRVVEWIYKK